MTEALRVEGEHFVRCIEKSEKPVTDAHLGLRVVELIYSPPNTAAQEFAATFKFRKDK